MCTLGSCINEYEWYYGLLTFDISIYFLVHAGWKARNCNPKMNVEMFDYPAFELHYITESP